MSYSKHITEVNEISKMLGVTVGDSFALIDGTLSELIKIKNPTQNDVLDCMNSYVDKFKRITKQVQQNPELLNRLQNNILSNYSKIERWEK